MQEPGNNPPPQPTTQSTPEQPQAWQTPPQQGYPPTPSGGPQMQTPSSNNKIAAGLCGILLGWLGVHKFVLGYNNEGVIMLLVSLIGGVLTCGAATGVISLIGLIEGIIYITKSDEEFMQTYVHNKKPWF